MSSLPIVKAVGETAWRPPAPGGGVARVFTPRPPGRAGERGQTRPPAAVPPAGPCPHEGPVLERWRSPCNARVERLSVRMCRHPDAPGRCAREDHPNHARDGVRVCRGRGCPLTAPPWKPLPQPDPPPASVRLLPPSDLSGDYGARVRALAEELRGPERPRPDGWLDDPATRDAHRLLADEVAAGPGPCPPCSGRGVVLVGGGRYEAGIYVACRMLRHVGCRLPVQVWHRGDAEPVGEAVRGLPGVEVCDLHADPRALRANRRVDGGWQAKLDAVIACGWREVIYLDADAYPVADPEPCFARNPAGLVVWPDGGTDDWIHWPSYGLSPAGAPAPVQGGHYVYDLARCWPVVAMAHHYDHHSEYYYQKPQGVGGYGDQDQVRAALHRLAFTPTRYSADPGLRRGVFVQAGPAGAPLFVHRCQSKMAPPGAFGRRRVRPRPDLPMEAVAWRYFREWPATSGAAHAG